MVFSSKLFVNSATVVRLVSFNYNNIFVTIDFFPLTASIEVTILANTDYNKRSIYLDRSSLLPVQSNMIISWRSPLLVILIDCKYAGQFLYLNSDHINALSLPCSHHNILLSNLNYIFYNSVRSALIQTACLDANFQFPTTLNATELYPNPNTVSTSTATPASTTTSPTFSYINNSIPFLSNDFALDANFMLSVFNARATQYQNLLDLYSVVNFVQFASQRLSNISYNRFY